MKKPKKTNIYVYMAGINAPSAVMSDEEIALYLLTGDYFIRSYQCGWCSINSPENPACTRCGGTHVVKHLRKKEPGWQNSTQVSVG